MPSAADNRPSSTAVGCDPPRSILAIIARETPDRSASPVTVSPRAARAACTVSAMEVARRSDIAATIGACLATIVVMIRDATREDAPACAVIYAPYVRDTAITFE